MNKHITIGAVILIAAVFVSGCANYGAVRATRTQDVTIDTLTKNWMNYKVYWTGLNKGEPTAIMFDPKEDGKTLTGAEDRWYEVGSKESLSSMIGWLKFNLLYYPYVWRVVGPDGQFYGYVYTGYTKFVLKVVDEKTMQVYGIPTTLRGEDRRIFQRD